MASAKKKLDEYHLKILRQLLTLPANKECFDCHQRGPTYVNVTIGSFVCTTCSGMLRGLTPPHRVKSVSMATFTPEEVDFVKARGNDYCRKTWLGLLDTQQPTKDEQQIKDFMVAKYERKRFYVDPAIASTLNKSVNGNVSSQIRPAAVREPGNTITVQPLPRTQASVQHHPTSLTLKPPSKQNNNNNMFTPDTFADFSNLSIPPPCDPFNSSQSAAAPAPSSQPSFADFDNNPVFTNSSSTGMPGVGESGNVPGEDRYAALKDLDCLMKQQQQQPTEVKPSPPPAAANGQEWTPGMTNGATNVWSAPSLFPAPINDIKDFNGTSNPFKGDGPWNNFNSPGANPFRNIRPAPNDAWSQIPNGQIVNGFPTSQSLNFAAPKVPWSNEAVSNPFAVGAVPQASHHSSNPFL